MESIKSGSLSRLTPRILATILFFLCAQSYGSEGSEILVVNRPDSDFFLSDRNFSIIEEKERSISIKEISSPAFAIRFDTSRITTDNDNRTSAYWYRFSLKSTLGKDQQLIYELLNFQLDKVNLYIPGSNGVYREYQSGDIYPFYSKLFNHKNFIFFLPRLDSGNVLTCYLRIEMNQKKVNRSRSVVRSENRFLTYAFKEYYFLGIFYGILLIMLVYNIILFITIRSSSYIYYTFYIVSVAFYSLSWNGLGFQYIWPFFPQFNDFALPVASYSLVLWASIYAKTFLLTSERSKILNWLFIFTIAGRTLFFIIALFFYQPLLSVYFIDIFCLLVGFVAGIISLVNRFRPARYYIVAYSLLFMGFGILTLLHQGIVAPNIFTVYSLEIAVVLELTFFSAALADRLKMLKISGENSLRIIIKQLEENKSLTEKVNRELEAKVQMRTEELQEANQKLKEQAEKITQMNLSLDLDNRKLRKDVKELYSARVFVRDTDMQEFNKLYPDDDSCYKYLSFLKWDEKYECKKCSNDKFFWGKPPFSRRCTRCGYEESVTSHTIFHNMRISIQKAFLIVFLVYSSNEEITSAELSRLVSIRQKTCWDYKKLISERIAKKKQELKTNKLGGWDKLILD